MTVSNIKDELSTRIDDFLEGEISDIVSNYLSEYDDVEFQYNNIPEEILLGINNDKIKQALILHSICLNDEEVVSDSFLFTYKKIIVPEAKFNSIKYTDKYISNNNKPVFLVSSFDDVVSFTSKDTSLYFAKALLDNWDTIEYSTDINIFFPDCPDLEEDKLLPFIKLLILAEGKFYHSRVESDNFFLDEQLKDEISCPLKDYTQYTDILNILSEYNNTKDVLQKYLLLYTILENFMYRKPIAELVSSNGFTIRNFKELYKKVENDELTVLKKLINKIYSNQLFPGVTVKDHIDSEYTDFIEDNSTCEEKFLRKLPYHGGNINDNFARLTYILRNCIVHNKETEFHLTHFELNKIEEGKVFFEGFMLPIIENIIYSILLKPTSFLDYNSPTINLYDMN